LFTVTQAWKQTSGDPSGLKTNYYVAAKIERIDRNFNSFYDKEV